MVENQADLSHFSALHSYAIADGLTQDPWLFWGLLRHFWSGKWEAGRGERDGTRAFLCIEHSMRLFERFEFAKVVTNTQQVNWSYIFESGGEPSWLATYFLRLNVYERISVFKFGPALSHSRIQTALGEGIMVQHVTPIKPLKQHVTQHFFAPWTFPQPLAKFIMHVDFVQVCIYKFSDVTARGITTIIQKEINLQFGKLQVSRDVSIWSQQTYTRNPVLIKEDASIRSFRAWYRQFYSDDKNVHAKEYMETEGSGKHLQL